MEKSIVSIAQAQCIVCGNVHDTGDLLLQHRDITRPKLDRTTLTHNDICPACCAQLEAGYIALVETRAPDFGRSELKPHEAVRTGTMAWVRRTAFPALFGQEPPTDKAGAPLPMVFIEPGVIDKLKALMGQ